jgi:hypothetical protein
MSAAILDQRGNPIGILGRRPGGIGRKYRECCIDDSPAESFGASYALGPPAYNLASTDDLTMQSIASPGR